MYKFLLNENFLHTDILDLFSSPKETQEIIFCSSHSGLGAVASIPPVWFGQAFLQIRLSRCDTATNYLNMRVELA